ncbi:hypothetical protein AB0O52_20855 [Arthrobacter sp. NPDC080073]|uniref:hypothetical protein n=1 Tax=Arthrobacter sp. NPDC080073 TaxID=3155919 RepID=UPI0034469B1B
MKSNAIIWLLLALIFGLYSAYIFSTIHRESPWSIISGVVLVMASLISLWKFVRCAKASKIEGNGQ